MPINPIKFVKIFNIKSGTEQVIPLATWETLSQMPKEMKNLNFLFNCDEDGNRVEQPRIEPIAKIETVKAVTNPDKAAAEQAVKNFTSTK